MIAWLAAVLLISAPCTMAAQSSSVKKPAFCHGLDCPDFDVKETTDAYELRSYAAAKWVSTEIDGYDYKDAMKKGFWKLFKYIGGKNQDSQKIAMTTPVRTLVHPSDGPFCKSKFTISFYVPPKFQSIPPTPEDDTVYIEEADAFEAYVTSYGGWQSVEKFAEHASQLYETLEKKKIAVKANEYYAVGYDSPFRLMNRHNEVWLIADKGDGAVRQDAQDLLTVQ